MNSLVDTSGSNDSTERLLLASITLGNETRRIVFRWRDGETGRFPLVWFRHADFFPSLGREDQLDDGTFRTVDAGVLSQANRRHG